jgi:MFS family permease
VSIEDGYEMQEPRRRAEDPGITDRERAAGMDLIIWDGVMSGTMATLTSGVFLTGFALLLGATETLVGLLNGLPRLASLVQPLGSYFVERLNARKRISCWVFGPARLLWLAVIALPLLGAGHGAWVPGMWLTIGIAVLSSLMAGFASPSWFAWMAELVPQRVRGRFFGRRTMYTGLVTAVIGFLAGRFIDLYKANYGNDSWGGFIAVFAFALASGMGSWYTLIVCPEPKVHTPEEDSPTPYWAMLRQVWEDRNFRNFVYFGGLINFGVWIASPFFSVYMIRVMELPYWLMGLLTGVNSLGSLVMVRLWGRLSDHFGNRPVISACVRGISLTPVLWVLSANGSWWPLVLAHLVGGVSWSGYFLAQMNMTFKLTPSERRSVYIALYYALSSLPSLFAPILGGILIQHSSEWHIQLGEYKIISYHVIFLASGLTRLMASGVFKRVHEPRAKSIRHMIRVLGHTRRFNPVRGVQYYRHRLSHAAAERRRRIERQRMRRKRDRR